MAENGKLSVLDGGTSAGFSQWIGAQRARGKTDEQTLRYVMKIWVDFAWSKVPPGDKHKIRTDLMQVVAKRQKNPANRRTSKVADEMRGTRAARIVYWLNWKNARAEKGAGFYRKARAFVSARAFSAMHHRAGFFPAYRFLKKSPEHSGPQYQKHPSGSAEGKFLEGLAEILVENFASSAPVPGRPAPLGMSGLAGDAFEASLEEIAEMFSRFVREDSIKQGQAAGFTVVNFG